MKLFWAALLLAAAPVAWSATSIDLKQRVDVIVAQQGRIREEVLAQKNGWEDVPATTRSQVLHDQDRLFELFQGKTVVGDLPADGQIEAANLLEDINAAVAGASDQRRVCTRERTVGSNFVHNVCRTMAEIHAEREAARNVMDSQDPRQRMQPTP